VQLSQTAVKRLLAQRGLTCQKPLCRTVQENRSLVEQWLRQELPRSRALATLKGAEIFFEDEAGIRSDFHAGATWAPWGSTPIMRVTGDRFGLDMLSAISARGALRFMVVEETVNSDRFCAFLARLVHNAPHPIFLIVDRIGLVPDDVFDLCLQLVEVSADGRGITSVELRPLLGVDDPCPTRTRRTCMPPHGRRISGARRPLRSITQPIDSPWTTIENITTA
jgi:hypothetical protein